MTRLIGFVIILVIVIVGYNYFMGDAEDKARATKIVEEVKGLGGSVKDIFMEEKEKYERGDYDKTLDKIGSFIDKLKKSPEKLEKAEQNEINDIETEIKRLQKELRNLSDEDDPTRIQIEKDLKRLVKKANELVKEVD